MKILHNILHSQKSRTLFFVSLLLALSIIAPIDAIGGSKGGHYVGGVGGGRKGSHYVNPSTGNHYQKRYESSTGTSHKYSSGASYSSHQPHKAKTTLHYDGSVHRNSHGRIERSESAKKEFLRERGYSIVPSGYQVDHIIPLYAGGSDSPDNMQLLTISGHRAKTKSDYLKYGR